MDTFVWINPSRFRQVEQCVEVDGMQVSVHLSPFDAPTSIRGRYFADRKIFEIQFEYMDSEPEGRTRSDGTVQFVEGRYSEKLLAIRIPVDAQPLEDIGLIQLQTHVVGALEKRIEALNPKGDRKKTFGRFLNSKAAQEVLTNQPDFRSIARAIQVS